MNRLHVIPYYAPAWAYGGSVRAATELTRALVRAGHRVTVLTTDTLSPHERAPVPRETLDGVEVVRARNLSNALRGRLNLSTPRGMAALARSLIVERRIDLVHCHELRTVENLRVAPVAEALDVPVVVSPPFSFVAASRASRSSWRRRATLRECCSFVSEKACPPVPSATK